MARIYWNGGRISRKIRHAIADGFEGLGALLVRRLRAKLNTPYPPASDPGEYPHRRSGTLRRSVYYRVDRRALVLYVLARGDIAEYWGFLQFGTHKMAPRPFLDKIMDENKPIFLKTIISNARKSLR